MKGKNMNKRRTIPCCLTVALATLLVALPEARAGELELRAGGLTANFLADGGVKLTDQSAPMAVSEAYQPLVIEDGKVGHKPVELVLAQPPRLDNGKVVAVYENRAKTLEVTCEATAGQDLYLSFRYAIRNLGKEPGFLKVRFQAPCLNPVGKDSAYWDGFKERLESEPGLQRKDLLLTFPACALYGKTSGLAIGLEAHQIFSEIENGIIETAPARFYYAAKTVVDPQKTEMVEFVMFAFKPDYGYRNALDIYYRIFPDVARTTPGVDPRATEWGAAVGSRGNPDTPIIEQNRRACSRWTWDYAPFKSCGDWYGSTDAWHKCSYEEKANSQSRYKTPAIYQAQRKRGLEVQDKLCDVASMFYIISWCDVVLADYKYSDAIVTDPETVNKLGPGWVHGGSSEYRMWWWNNRFAADTMRDLKKITAELPISGFAIDCAGSAGGGLHAKCRNPGVEKSPGRAYDEKGIFCDESVAVAKMTDYIHSLTRGDRHMGTVMNGGHQYLLAFRTDSALFEGPPIKALMQLDEMEAHRALLGHKPMVMYFSIGAHDNIGKLIDWKDFPPEKIRDVYRSIWDYLLLLCLEYEAYPVTGYVYGAERWMRYAPAVCEVLSQGWEPVPAFRLDRNLWHARYGRGLSSYLFVGNQTVDEAETTIQVDNAALGAGCFVFGEYFGRAITNVVREGKTEIACGLKPHEVLLLKPLAAIGGISNAVAGCAESDEVSEGSIRVNINKPDRSEANISVRLPKEAAARTVMVNGTPAQFTGVEGGVAFPAVLLTNENAIVVQWISPVFAASRKVLYEFPFLTDEGKAGCSIVLEGKTNELDRCAALRLQDYFKVYTKGMTNGAEVVLPIVNALPAGDEAALVIRGGNNPARVAMEGDRLVLQGPDAESRYALMNRLMRILDGKYVYVGTIAFRSDIYPNDKQTQKMREAAGFARGAVFTEGE